MTYHFDRGSNARRRLVPYYLCIYYIPPHVTFTLKLNATRNKPSCFYIGSCTLISHSLGRSEGMMCFQDLVLILGRRGRVGVYIHYHYCSTIFPTNIFHFLSNLSFWPTLLVGIWLSWQVVLLFEHPLNHFTQPES